MKKGLASRMVSSFLIVLVSLLILFPFLWILSSSFKRQVDIIASSPRLFSFTPVAAPLSGPGVVTATTLSFIFSWNNFLFSQVLSMEKTRTLPIAVYNFVSNAEVDWGAVMAAAVAIMTPAIILTMIFQKYVVQGLTVGAVKG